MFRASQFGRPFATALQTLDFSPSNPTSVVSVKRSLHKMILRHPSADSMSSRLLSGQSSKASTNADKAAALKKEKEELQAEAKALTLKLYRTVTRSVRTIRWGNEHDEKEFVEREKKRKESKPTDKRLSMLSMLPPVDREDELRSRAEYYQQYARENFVQESDCFGRRDDWDPQHVARYIHHLRQGDKHRKWLLGDMKFPDPYEHSFDHARVDEFERRALDYVERAQDFKLQKELSPEEYELYQERRAKPDDGQENDEDEDDGWSSDDEDLSSGLPPWYKNPRGF